MGLGIESFDYFSSQLARTPFGEESADADWKTEPFGDSVST